MACSQSKYRQPAAAFVPRNPSLVDLTNRAPVFIQAGTPPIAVYVRDQLFHIMLLHCAKAKTIYCMQACRELWISKSKLAADAE